MKKGFGLMILLCLFGSVFFCSLSFGMEEKVALAQEVAPEIKLSGAKQSIETIYDLQNRKVISPEVAKEQVDYYLSQAQKSIEEPVEGGSIKDELNGQKSQKANERSVLDKMKGYMTFWNIIMFGASAMLVIGFGVLFVIYILPVINAIIPAWFYEIIIYSACGACFAYAEKFPAGANYIALLGCLGIIGGFALTNYVHNEGLGDFYEATGISPLTLSFFIFFVTWSSVAIYYNSQMIGFMAVIALEAFFGFSVIVTPLCYGIGFSSKDVIPRATVSSLIVLTLYVVQQIFQFPIPYFEVFSKGALFMGAFVYYLGLLIMSSRYYKDSNYLLMQIITIISGVAAFYIGSVFGIKQLVGVGGTFFVLYIIEKYFDICWSNKHWAWGITGLGGLLYGLGMLLKANPQYFLLGF